MEKFESLKSPARNRPQGALRPARSASQAAGLAAFFAAAIAACSTETENGRWETFLDAEYRYAYSMGLDRAALEGVTSANIQALEDFARNNVGASLAVEFTPIDPANHELSSYSVCDGVETDFANEIDEPYVRCNIQMPLPDGPGPWGGDIFLHDRVTLSGNGSAGEPAILKDRIFRNGSGEILPSSFFINGLGASERIRTWRVRVDGKKGAR